MDAFWRAASRAVPDSHLGLFIRDGRRLSVAETYEDIRAKLSEQATH
jgi:hypothetical protein